MDSTVLFCGLPGSGKSTYLGLLDIAITSGARSMRLATFEGDREYVNGLAAGLFRCQELERTKVDEVSGLSLDLGFNDGSFGHLSVPDRSGEVWRSFVRDRTMVPDLYDAAQSCVGVCLFVRVDTFLHDPTIVEAARVATAFGGEATGDESPVDPRSIVSAGQVAITDLAQVLASNLSSGPRRLSVILSAFDRCRAGTPDEWLKANAPLLAQFLRTNDSTVESRIFGVSAQGGSYETERERLLEDDPVDRAWAKAGDGSDAPIDDPLLWALGRD